ncbi:hypothetical protein [Bacillus ndiopicus]|uniref:hypothetical protein n=1 Tax=Bacillus ndiopicus TaxID=1347368 RepID=UPI000A9C6C86|nr:hypothetical protein [Bacillus ndiopicus]
MQSGFYTGDILFSAFSIFGILFSIIPIVFFVWFAITTTTQLKKQSKLLEEIKERLDR